MATQPAPTYTPERPNGPSEDMLSPHQSGSLHGHPKVHGTTRMQPGAGAPCHPSTVPLWKAMGTPPLDEQLSPQGSPQTPQCPQSTGTTALEGRQPPEVRADGRDQQRVCSCLRSWGCSGHRQRCFCPVFLSSF